MSNQADDPLEPTAGEVLIRRATAEDMPRVVREWLNSFRGSRWSGPVPNNLYKKVYGEGIRQLLDRGAVVDVACWKEQPSLLLGFICSEHTPRDRILHYCFVRSAYRQEGIAKALQLGAGIVPPFVYTYRTDDASYICHGQRHLKELACRRDAYKADPEAPAGAMN